MSFSEVAAPDGSPQRNHQRSPATVVRRLTAPHPQSEDRNTAQLSVEQRTEASKQKLPLSGAPFYSKS